MSVLDTLLKLWNSSATDDHYDRNESLKPAEILEQLQKAFPTEQIVAEISQSLGEMVALMSSDEVPSRRDIFLGACCLSLIADPQGVRVPLPLVQDIVRTFPMSIWYRALIPVVSRYLSRADLLEALIKNLSGTARPSLVENALQGVRMYGKFARKDDDPRRLIDLKNKIAPLIERYLHHQRIDFARHAERAPAALQQYFT